MLFPRAGRPGDLLRDTEDDLQHNNKREDKEKNINLSSYLFLGFDELVQQRRFVFPLSSSAVARSNCWRLLRFSKGDRWSRTQITGAAEGADRCEEAGKRRNTLERCTPPPLLQLLPCSPQQPQRNPR